MTRIGSSRLGLAGLLATVALSGCGAKVEKTAEGATVVKPVSISVADLQRRSVVRTVDVVGTLRGWEEVSIGAKKAGRILKVVHDFGDKVLPADILVEFDTTDALLGVQQAEARYLGELSKLGITRKQAEEYLAKFGMGERILIGEDVEKRIREVPVVVQTQLAVERAQLNLQRQKQLAGRGAGTVQDYQNAENDAASAVAAFSNAIVTARSTLANALASKVALDVAQQTLTDMTIKVPVPTKPPADAPVSYSVIKKVAKEGQMVKEGDPLFELVIERPLRLWASVPEKYTPEVALGQDVSLTVASRPKEAFLGKVSRINPSIDSVSRTFQVEAIVPNPNGLLHPGGFAKASIVTRTDSEAAVVPLESVVKFAGVTKIFVVENDKARAIPVETGLEGTDWVEVIGALPAQGKVVTSGQSILADGTLVTVRTVEKEATKGTPATTHTETKEAAK